VFVFWREGKGGNPPPPPEFLKKNPQGIWCTVFIEQGYIPDFIESSNEGQEEKNV
jgi:hypothetical protein